jgi:hypothetical protein
MEKDEDIGPVGDQEVTEPTAEPACLPCGWQQQS